MTFAHKVGFYVQQRIVATRHLVNRKHALQRTYGQRKYKYPLDFELIPSRFACLHFECTNNRTESSEFTSGHKEVIVTGICNIILDVIITRLSKYH